MRPWVWSPGFYVLGVVRQTCNPSTLEVETGGWKVQAHSPAGGQHSILVQWETLFPGNGQNSIEPLHAQLHTCAHRITGHFKKNKPTKQKNASKKELGLNALYLFKITISSWISLLISPWNKVSTSLFCLPSLLPFPCGAGNRGQGFAHARWVLSSLLSWVLRSKAVLNAGGSRLD